MITPRKMPQFMFRLKLNPNTCTTVAEGGAEIIYCGVSAVAWYKFLQIVRSIIHYYWYFTSSLILFFPKFPVRFHHSNG